MNVFIYSVYDVAVKHGPCLTTDPRCGDALPTLLYSFGIKLLEVVSCNVTSCPVKISLMRISNSNIGCLRPFLKVGRCFFAWRIWCFFFTLTFWKKAYLNCFGEKNAWWGEWNSPKHSPNADGFWFRHECWSWRPCVAKYRSPVLR